MGWTLRLVVALSVAFMTTNAIAQGGEPESSDQTGASSVSPEQKSKRADQQLMEIEIRNVSMWCGVYGNGHGVRITASNSENRNRSCESRCYYRDNHANNGTLYASGTVPARANNVVFGSYSDSSRTFTVTNPGSFTCR